MGLDDDVERRQDTKIEARAALVAIGFPARLWLCGNSSDDLHPSAPFDNAARLGGPKMFSTTSEHFSFWLFAKPSADPPIRRPCGESARLKTSLKNGALHDIAAVAVEDIPQLIGKYWQTYRE